MTPAEKEAQVKLLTEQLAFAEDQLASLEAQRVTLTQQRDAADALANKLEAEWNARQTVDLNGKTQDEVNAFIIETNRINAALEQARADRRLAARGENNDGGLYGGLGGGVEGQRRIQTARVANLKNQLAAASAAKTEEPKPEPAAEAAAQSSAEGQSPEAPSTGGTFTEVQPPQTKTIPKAPDPASTSVDFSYLQPGEISRLSEKIEAAKAENDPKGPKAMELGLYAQGLKALVDQRKQGMPVGIQGNFQQDLPGTSVEVNAANDKGMDLIPFPFLSSDQAQALSATVRVFIMGVEVSDYVSSASWSGNAATSDLNCGASLTLKCPHDLLTITPKNINSSIGDDQVNWVISSDPMYSEQVKRDIYEYKRRQNYFERTTNVPRWNLAPNTCIFHHADTVRIFVQLPWTSKDAWLPVFNGYLQNPQVSRQVSGQDDISVSCDTLANRLAKARVFNQMNAEILNPKSSQSRLPSSQEFTGITNIDVVDTSILFADTFGSAANALLDTSLEGLLRFIFYGDLSQSNKLFKRNEQKDLEAALAEYFHKKDSLAALMVKKNALGVDYSDQIKKLTSDMEGVKKKILALPGGSSVIDSKGTILDSTYVTSALRGRRALGFLDPSLFITDFTFPFSGKVIEADNTTKSSTQTSKSTTTTYSKQLPLNLKLKQVRISSQFQQQEGFRTKPHTGVDIPVRNQSVVAPINGHVLEVNYDASQIAGLYVRILGEDGYVQGMFHLSSIGSVKFGDYVSKGAQIGVSGNTGRVHKTKTSEGYHLHWEVWKWHKDTPDWNGSPVRFRRPNGSLVDPIVWLGSESLVDSKNTVPEPTPELPNKLDRSTIDWDVEVESFELWKKNCLVGWANGVPDLEVNTSVVDSSVFSNTECRDIAISRTKAYLTYDEVTIIGRNSGLLGQYSPHGQNVAVVLRSPKQGWGYNLGATTDFQIQGASFEINTQTRAQILIELLSKVDYYWWVSGNGDIIFDFPNYEMLPDHYGQKFRSEYTLEGLGANDVLSEDVASLKSTYLFRGNIGGPVESKAGQMEMLSRVYPAIYKIPSLAARNGIEVEEIFWPYITSQEQLRVLGALHIRKAIANAFHYSVAGLPPLLYITPNTAVYLADIDAYALVQTTNFGYSADGSVSCELEFTAIRQKLTEEQMFLKLGLKQSDVAKEDIDVDEIDKVMKAWKAQPVEKGVLNRIQRISTLYGFIFGSGDLLIDYTKTYSQNILAADKWSVKATDDRGAYAAGNIVTFQDSPGVQRLTSTPSRDDADLQTVEVHTQLHLDPVAPLPEQVEALDLAFADLGVESLKPALLAHGNVTSSLQSRWTSPNFSSVSDLLTKGVGFLGLTSKVLGQLDKTLGNLGQIGDRVEKISQASFDALESLKASGKNLQALKARAEVVDPRMDPVFSGRVAAAITEQVLNSVNTSRSYDQKLTTSEINPDVFAYALQLGPSDPAFLELLATQDIRDLTEANSSKMGRALQNILWRLGGYTKKDLDYVDAYQNMKKQAARRGLHN